MDTTVSDPVIGRALDGRYRVVSRVARGGMGTVYVALDTRLDRTVAVKVMHPALAEDEDFVRRFIGEAKAAARLSHPNVVGVYDQGQDSGHVYLAMEHVPGRTLRDLLREQGRLDPGAALSIAEAVVAALGVAHRNGLVHRDVKPENVLLADDGQVKVTDFGLARAVAAPKQTKTGMLMGTVAYLAPEQVKHGAADPRSDVYAAGVLLYELLTGEPPFQGETPLAVAYQHVNNAVPAPSSVVGEVPPELDALVAHATAREADHRPPDGQALLAETQRIRATLPAAGAYGTAGTPHDDRPTEMLGGGGRGGSVNTLVVGRSEPDTAEPDRGRRWFPPLRDRPPLLRAAVLVLAAVALLLFGIAGYTAWWTTVPTGLAGTTVDAATAKARAAGLSVETARAQFHGEVPEGRVIRTDPGAGERIRRGGTLTLIPSKGPPRVAIPDVSGMKVPAATKKLESVGLRVGEVRRDFSATVAKGEVISTSPDIGSEVPRGGAVDLQVSRGIEIPDVRGWVLDRAEEELRSHGFDIDISEGFSDAVPKGRVMSQEPARGGAAKGTTIELTVSQGPPVVPIPDVVGMKLDEAVRTLEEAGFEVDVNRIRGNHVRFQRPAGEAPKGTTVNLLVF